MIIFSNGCRIFNNEQDARNTILNWIKSSQAIALNSAYRVSEIKEKSKIERNGIRHIFYFYDWTTKESKKPFINSFSYLERNIEIF